MWQINTYGNGDVLSDVFRSIVFLMGGGYESLLRLGMVCLVFGAIAAFLARGRIHWQWVMGAIVILAVTINIRTTVLVHDLVNPGVADQIIDNVPLAVSFPAYMTSEISYQTMVGVETAFGLPAQYRVVNSTIGKGFFDMQKTMGLELIPGDLQANVTNYLKDCVFRAIELNQLNRETIVDAANMATAIQVDNAALVTMEIRLGNPFAEMTCPAMYDQYITNGLVDGQVDYDETMKQFRAALGEQNIADAELTPVQTFANNIMGTAQDPRVIINNVLLRERWKDAEKLEAEDGNDTSSAVVQMTKSISEDLKNQAYNDSLLAARFVPLIRTVSESVIYLLTPLMLALAMSPAMFATIRGVVMSYGWLFMWIPMYAIFNFVTFQYGVQQMNLISVNQLTFNSYDQYLDVLLGLNTFMGRLIWAVPTLATVVTYGMSSMASALSGAAGGAQAAATQEASAYAHGQGSYIEPGQHLKEQELPMVQDVSGGFHAGATYFGGGTGTSIHRQDGSSIVSYGDGSSLHISRDGITQQYHGPEGSWSKHGDVYEAGVWRQEVRDADGQTHLAQFEVSGDHVDVSYMKQDGHGVQHDIRETWNQSMNEQKSVSDTWADKGFTHQLTTLGDHSQHMKTVGTSTVPVTRNGKTEMITADITASFSRSSPNEPWGAGVMTAHSTEHGDFQYSLSDVHTDDRGVPDLSQGMTVRSSHGTDQAVALGDEHGLLTHDTQGADGSHQRQYRGTPAEGVWVLGPNGEERHFAENFTLSGTGGVAADGKGLPFTGHLTGDLNGFRGEIEGNTAWNEKNKRWEMVASNEEWKSLHQGQTSGMTMKVGKYTARGGNFAFHGDPHIAGTPFTYEGPISDGKEMFRGRLEMGQDGQIYMSNLDKGESRHAIDPDGSYTVYKGDLHSSEGGTYERFRTLEHAAVPYVNGNGKQVYAVGRATERETGRAAYNEHGDIEHHSAATHATLVAPGIGRFDFTVGSTAEKPGETIPIPGTVASDELEIDGQHYDMRAHMSKHDNAGPGTYSVLTPVEGSLRATMEKHEIHNGDLGPVASKETANPRTGAPVASDSHAGATFEGPKWDGNRIGFGRTQSLTPGGSSIGGGTFSNTDTASITRPIDLANGIKGVEHVDRMEQANHPDVALSNIRNVNHAEVESPLGGVMNRVDSSAGDHHTLSGEITEGVGKRSKDNVWEKDEVVLTEIDGLDGMFKISRHSTLDLATGEVVSSSYQNTRDGHLIAQKKMGDGSWQTGIVHRVSDGQGHTITRFRALDESSYVGHGGYVSYEQGAPGASPAYSSGMKGSNFKTQDNLTSEHLGNSSYDKFGLVKEAYNHMFDDQIGPGNDALFRKFADVWAASGVVIDSAEQAVDMAWRFKRFKNLSSKTVPNNSGGNSSLAPEGGGSRGPGYQDH